MRSSFSTSLLSPSYVYLEFLIWACTHYFPAPVDFYSAHIHSFNPHSRKGNDGDDSKPEDGIYIFQSTFPRGERLSFSLQNCIYSRDFNPRSREGNDVCQIASSNYFTYFNPRSREGNDFLKHYILLLQYIYG